MALEAFMGLREGPMGLVLASESSFRRKLMESAGLACEAVGAPIDESAIGGEGPVEVAIARAQAKARSVHALRQGHCVIGADQVVHLEGRVFHKPCSGADWKAQLCALKGRTHELVTAVCIIWPGEEETFCVHSRVRFRADLGETDLDAYIEWGEASACAGGYMVEGRGAWLIESVEGDWNNVIGLPILPLIGRLRARGWHLGPSGWGGC